jgi:hypothetical protein
LKVFQPISALSGAFQANVGQSASSRDEIHADINAGSATIIGGMIQDDFAILPSKETTINVFGGHLPKPPSDSLALFSKDLSDPSNLVSKPRYVPLPDDLLNPNNNPQGKFTFDPPDIHKPIKYFGIRTIGGLTLKAFSTQVAPMQFTIGVSASLFTKDGGRAQLPVIPAVPVAPVNPFVVAPQFVDPAVTFSAPSLAVGDVDGDGTPELIVGNGPGLQPVVTVFDIRNLFNPVDFPAPTSILRQFLAFDPRFRGGVWVATGNLDSDQPNFADIIVGAGGGAGSQPRVKVYKNITPGQGINMMSENGDGFLAYEPGFTGGVRVAVGNVTGRPVPDIITAPGVGHAPIVEIFDGASESHSTFDATFDPKNSPAPLISFPAYDPSDPSFMGGVFIAVGDYDNDGPADKAAHLGSDDIMTGPGLRAQPVIKVFNGEALWTMTMVKGPMLTFHDASNTLLADFPGFQPPVSGPVTTLFPDDSNWINGVSGVAFGNRDGQFIEIVIGSGQGQATKVRVILTDPPNPPIGFALLPDSSGHIFLFKDFDFKNDFENLDIPFTAFGALVGGFGAPFAF